MATLYELVKEIENFDLDIDEETGEILNGDELDALQLEKDTKVENICLWIKNLKADAVAYKAEKESFEKKRKAAERRAEYLQEYIQYILAGEKFKSDRVTVSYRKSEQVECTDLLDVDIDYLRYKEPELDKKKIKDAIKAGIEVKGCQLVERQNLQIR
ncbi:MAG: siphovirus Gp157 family protein [Lachnospiraceae bacterium]|nr:siphovirus Gp157 family protein [Lachnospiraceae bacterium]